MKEFDAKEIEKNFRYNCANQKGDISQKDIENKNQYKS